ncbi:hypothetical protein DEU32_1145 [Curtobacterium sp. AG1037]|uniref:hypothetical protein n=1 Tax=Curtobacterium sp. AG1037 TaxID=2183990 RepID=UPI000E0A56D3|nr:hypothetical protein [Curtobacterium sp. AG1037]RDH95040.1 hypothetical protein DEU32_1145 [Curtobacterium sp. AG1037]
MSGAASDEDQPDDTVTVESDTADRKVFHIEPKNADPAKRRRYTRAEVNERMDQIAEALDAPDRLMQQVTQNAMGPALTKFLAQNDSMTKFIGDMVKSPTIAALAATGPFDKVAKGFVPPIATGIDWASVAPPVSVKLAGMDLPSSLMGVDWASMVPPSSAKLAGLGLPSHLVDNLGIFDGVQATSGLAAISSQFAGVRDDVDERFSSEFAGALPASSSMVEWQPTDHAWLDLPPNPVHETNARMGELVEILRAEREDHLRDQQRDAEALAEQKRKNAQDRALLRISERRRRADAWKNWAALGAGLVGAVAGVLALFH